MPLEAGQHLSHYRLVRQIGEGGMGVVWQARDTTLDREVAIKVLPPAVASDGERLQRFEREARVLASLNHPNIATIHGFHSVDGVHFLVMELVEGEDLEAVIAREPLSLERTVEIATQIARALETAHAKGVVHRDLKPANVKLTADGDAKVLDFGLAKALAAEDPAGAGVSGPGAISAGSGGAAGSDPSSQGSPGAPTSHAAPTMTSTGTTPGMILGTAAYMAPEQARGKPVDRRADMWAFGCLLFEMLTRTRGFDGETISDTIAAVLTRDPDWSALPSDTPPAIRRLLRRCLVKDPRNRLSDAADARIELCEALDCDPDVDGALSSSSTSPADVASGSGKLPWLVTAVTAIVAILAIAWMTSNDRAVSPVGARQPVELSVYPGEIELSRTEMQSLAMSPDGRKLVFYGVDDPARGSSLFLRTLDDPKITRIPGTDGAQNPFFSPDGEWVGFFSDGEIRKIRLGSSNAIKVCSTSGRPRGATWSDDGRIIFSPRFTTALFAVSDAGGEPVPLTELDRSRDERTHRWPHAVPGHDVVLFTVATTENPEFYDDAQIVAFDTSTGERKTVYTGAAFARYVPTGHLILASGGFLHAAPFDIDALETTGDARLVAEGVASHTGSGVAYMSVSSTGVLAYFPGESARQRNRLTWMYEDGTSEPMVGTGMLQQTIDPDVSPDGTRVAASVPNERARDIWVTDLASGTRTRLTLHGDNRRPVWTRDGESVAFTSSLGDSGRSLYVIGAGTSGEPRELYTHDGGNVELTGFSPDGKFALLQIGTDGANDIYLYSPDSGADPVPLIDSEADEQHARFSPDGNWIAYTSNETGTYEIFVRPYPGPGGRWQISRGGGMIPRWSSDGSRIHYRLHRGWWQVDADPGNAPGNPFRANAPRLVRNDLFYTDLQLPYALSPDDDAILLQVQEWLVSPEIRVVVDWFARLEDAD